jgi:hypothetical protein
MENVTGTEQLKFTHLPVITVTEENLRDVKAAIPIPDQAERLAVGCITHGLMVHQNGNNWRGQRTTWPNGVTALSYGGPSSWGEICGDELVPTTKPLPGFSRRPPRKRSKGHWLWPTITDMESATEAAYMAAGACFLCCGITVLFLLLGEPGLSRDVWFDLSIIALLGFFIARYKSRTAAVLATLIFVAERYYQFTTTDVTKMHGGAYYFGMLLFAWFFHGIRGTFAYHTYKKQ